LRSDPNRATAWYQRPSVLPWLAAFLAVAAACTAEDRPQGPPQRLVALAPNLTETLFALDLGERVVGVGRYSSWPPEVESKPRLGGLVDPSLEALLALQPDLAILLTSEDDLAAHLRRLGIEVLLVRNDTLSDVEESMLTIAQRCGVPEAGQRLVTQWHHELEPRDVAQGARIMLSVGRSPGRLTDILVAAPGTFLDELLVRLGGVNVFSDVGLPYPQVNLEEVVRRRPEVILELQGIEVSADAEAALAADWQHLPDIPAVANRRIYVLAGDWVLIPGPRLPRLYTAMAESVGNLHEPRDES
jgi:iron complex transport system substrate-binding protein